MNTAPITTAMQEMDRRDHTRVVALGYKGGELVVMHNTDTTPDEVKDILRIASDTVAGSDRSDNDPDPIAADKPDAPAGSGGAEAVAAE